MSRGQFAQLAPERSPPTLLWEQPKPATAVDVLVVDDNEVAVQFLCELLGLEGLTCAVAFDGHEALQTLECIRPRLLLLDIRMPIMDGIELLHRVRASHKHCDLPIIFVSAEDPATIIDPLARTIPYVRKPVNARELLKTISSHLCPELSQVALAD